jgi:hypothetical protein
VAIVRKKNEGQKKGERKKEKLRKLKPSKAPLGPNANDAFFVSYNACNT